MAATRTTDLHQLWTDSLADASCHLMRSPPSTSDDWLAVEESEPDTKSLPRSPTIMLTSQPKTVMVVDDDERIRVLMSWKLESEGFNVVGFPDGESALESIDRSQPDLVVLDLGLSSTGIGGLDMLRKIRTVSDPLASLLPVIVVSGRTGQMDRIVALDMGADDYLVKPANLGELAARIRAVLRRSNGHDLSPLRFGDLYVDLLARTVTVGDVRVELTAREFDLLAFMAGKPGQVFTRAQLLTHVWRSSSQWQDQSTVTEHVHRIRQKVEYDPSNPQWIKTVRRVGYQITQAS
ncbi:response regulator transcription factor [Rhodococcus sp. 1168]|uniref:response regulator transcription factor n=1 Tax=Rhodococcus sp. 1168 TaxID=2018041 RepID=UPI0020CAF28E|nr:response regulator transcription factor [Rhodococcus sp. 1168]